MMDPGEKLILPMLIFLLWSAMERTKDGVTRWLMGALAFLGVLAILLRVLADLGLVA